MIRIAPFEPRFAEGVVAVILPIQPSEFEIPIALEGQPDLRDIAAIYQKEKGKGNFWVALADDEVVGTVGLLDPVDLQGDVPGDFRAQARLAWSNVTAQLRSDCSAVAGCEYPQDSSRKVHRTC